jgi:hypothetical protein
MAAKGRTIEVAAELGQTSDNNRILIVQTFDQQVTPVGLRHDLIMAQQGAQLTL